MTTRRRPKVRSRALTVRISRSDYKVLVQKAEAAGMTQSEYVRFLIRNAQIGPVRVSVEE